MKSPFDLVILDLDGTVIDPHAEMPIRPAVIDAVRRVRSAGIRVTLATGRTLEYAAARALALGIDEILVTSQGAVLGRPSGEVLHRSILGRAASLAVAEWAARAERVIAFYLVDRTGRLSILQNREQRLASVYDHWFGAPRVVAPDLARHVADPGLEPLKFIVVNVADAEPDLCEELQGRFGPEVLISRTHECLIEGTARGVHKGSGVRRLLELLRIPPKRALAIGDNENDLPVFAAVGTSVAMGQAPERVRRAADWVAPPLDRDGAAVALRRLVLGEPAAEGGEPSLPGT
ncbi:MAG: HAD family phosphatase [Armatimonadetes bacterium]|nr:HAD family phosphatase [Armatimonadota bacterium]